MRNVQITFKSYTQRRHASLMMSLVTCLIVFVAMVAFFSIRKARLWAKLPPGPPRLPFIGNLHQAPTNALWLTFQNWVKQYGPLVGLDFGGTIIIIVGDYETARDLLDKRASIYSSRPRMVMAQELVCKGHNILFRPSGADLSRHQQMEAPVLSPRASTSYTPLQDIESRILLKNFLNTNDYEIQFERYAASIVYTLAYGLRVETGKEWQLQANHQNVEHLVLAGEMGRWIVDSLPFLKYLPGFLAPWKKTAEKWHRECTDMATTNMQDALSRDGWNWSKDFANSKEAKQMPKVELAWDLSMLCDAGIETTNMMLQIFTLACLAYPYWIPIAQRELDSVVDDGRLPSFEDLDKLPYIHAVMEEIFRWRHILPTGIPHATTKDDHYKGFLIPKNSIIIPLFISMRNDSSLYQAPSEFRPERWLNGKAQSGNFGYGRRICPGRFIARNSLAIAVSRLLWGFNITGRQMFVDEDSFTKGFVSSPKRFEAYFEARSEKHRTLIEMGYQQEDKDVPKLLDEIRARQVASGLTPRT
ncbi:hypothetical protein HBH53_034660 [Parastagonospora nodorum]|nr:hypothetical protein HBH53_034660 [Parastagonospora nodorum]KAH3984512.1 hypothetical protein HBH51_024790 [Parastagonospora nodorum]KAH5027706.1 hypothetical protein HBI74_111360 [Parastagonospora nodorum]KAH5362318.1 hypothetical protein HBI48_087370 [Parastagonospora nodorum]KAH5586175.1 hypothetical protein HBI45_235450 [Parastagonospora nodorum]